MIDLIASFSSVVEGTGFPSDRTGVSFLDHHSESRFYFLCLWYSCPEYEAKLHANVLFRQINRGLHFSGAVINNR
jgi:hypothetical protein